MLSGVVSALLGAGSGVNNVNSNTHSNAKVWVRKVLFAFGLFAVYHYKLIGCQFA